MFIYIHKQPACWIVPQMNFSINYERLPIQCQISLTIIVQEDNMNTK